MAPSVEIDERLCVGSGECAESLPTVFSLSDDGVGIVTGDTDSLDATQLRAVVVGCPSRAIALVLEKSES